MQGAVIVGFLSLELEIGNEISYECMDTVTFLVSCLAQRTGRVPASGADT